MGTDHAGSYLAAGVDEEREQAVFQKFMRPLLTRTKIATPYVESLAGIDSGHFATVIQFHGKRKIAVSTDGVGTKILIARMARRYDTIGIDCVANNVNDLLCLGADPLILLDYIAISRIDEVVLRQVAEGLAQGADEAGIAIPGGEIAQVADLLAHADGDQPMLDLVGTALGSFPLDQAEGGPRELLEGAFVSPGDVIIGFPSSGLHSNGYSLARRVLFQQAGMLLSEPVLDAGTTLEEALLKPTVIYVDAVKKLWNAGIPLHGMVHVSGGGLLNLSRLPANVSYIIDNLPTPLPIFRLIQEAGELQDREMFATFNMGVGLCCIVPERAVSEAVTISEEHGGFVLGRVQEGPERTVTVSQKGLVGTGDRFFDSTGLTL